MSLFKKYSKRFKVPMPGGTDDESAKVLKIGAALAGNSQFMLDPEVLGARGSAKKGTIGLSVDRAKEYATDRRNAEIAARNAAAAAAAESAAQEQARLVQNAQLAARRRNKRFAYGYDRTIGGGLGDSGGAAGDRKTLLGY